jgi:hypothetical protein
MVDDLLTFSKDPEKIICPIQELFGYELKNLGVPDYYSGADIEFNKDKGYWEMSVNTYINNVTTRLESLLNVTLQNYGSPLEVGNHPEMDETAILFGEEISIYQMLIGCAQ